MNIFDEKALEANRDGYMTKAQRKQVDTIRREVRFVQIAVVAIAVFILISMAQNPAAVFFCGSLIGLYVAFILLYSSSDTRRVNRDLRKGQVKMVEGMVSFPLPSWHNRLMKVGDRKFRISGAIYRQIQNQPYKYFRVYYAPHTNTLLSMEPPGIIMSGAQITDPSRLEDDTAIPTENTETENSLMENTDG